MLSAIFFLILGGFVGMLIITIGYLQLIKQKGYKGFDDIPAMKTDND